MKVKKKLNPKCLRCEDYLRECCKGDFLPKNKINHDENTNYQYRWPNNKLAILRNDIIPDERSNVLLTKLRDSIINDEWSIISFHYRS